MRTDYVKAEQMKHILAALMPANRLVMEIALDTGLRLGDVLNLRSETLREKGQRFTVKELKTGKPRRIRLKTELYTRALSAAGKLWVFEHRTNTFKHRTRSAVYKDLKRAAALFRLPLEIPKAVNIAPHSARKIYAVDMMKRTGGDLAAVQRDLNHRDPTITALYAMADALTEQKVRRTTNKRQGGA